MGEVGWGSSGAVGVGGKGGTRIYKPYLAACVKYTANSKHRFSAPLKDVLIAAKYLEFVHDQTHVLSL